MIRPWLLLLSLASLLALVACSDSPSNEPPTIQLVYPDPGHMVTVSPDSMIANVQDDRGIRLVEFYFDGNLLSTKTSSPYTTRLPAGAYADGNEYVIGARATDIDGARSAFPTITITIDPSLQTIPQITTFDLDQDGTGNLRLSWLTFPGTVDEYEWEVSRDDGFFEIVATGAVSDTTVVVAVVAEGLAYARVRAMMPDAETDWSRAARFDHLTTWRDHYGVAGNQLGTGIYQAADGTLRILSNGVDRHRVSRAAVQMLALDANHELVTVHELFDDTYHPTAQALDADGNLRLAGYRDDGTGFVAAVTLEGAVLWSAGVDFMHCTTLLAEEDGSWRTVGADLRDGAAGGVFATVAGGGAVTAGPTFTLEAGREVVQAWHRPAGGWIVGGQLPDDSDGRPGGIWIRGLDTSYEEDWNLRLGTGRNYLVRGGGSDGAGNYVLGGIALVPVPTARFGFILGYDEDGRIRWQLTDRSWHLFADAYPDAGGRWTVAGVRVRPSDSATNEYDFGMRAFSGAGLPLWERRYQSGAESQGWVMARHPAGGWWTAGTRTSDFVDFDVDVLRVDDRGELD